MFEGLRSAENSGGSGHKIQDIKELMDIPVVVLADMTKSPPVLMVYAANP